MSDLNDVYEKIGAMDAKITAAHTRMDVVADDIKEIKGDLKLMLAAENKRTGWIAAMMFIGTLLGGIITYFVKG